MKDDTAIDAKAAARRRRVPVGLGARSYEILIGPGLLAEAGKLIGECAPGAACAIVTDETVAGLHLPALEAGIAGSGTLKGIVTVGPGEASKSFGQFAPLCEKLLALGVERDDLIVALGGGVIGDLAGFAAAVLRRGVRLVQAPTTLLAQVDSSVGGKTGINTPQGKNLIGAFHQPLLVIADTATLETLPERQFRSGYAEIVKYGLLGDADFFGWLEQEWRAVFAGGEARARAIETSCLAKAAIVEADEREAGTRALLNLGHTFGHALEAFAGYSDRLLHGEAIAIGMNLAFAFSAELGLCGKKDAKRVAAHLAAAGLPVSAAEIAGDRPDPQALMALIAQDKKVRGGKPAFILARGIGEAYIERDVPMDKLQDFLERICDAA